ncbi:transcriptional regulator [Salinarimonas ramus]|uniref:Transcriptional regulator n=1 Tax=Salinarimonas ramus TaxID=690164 RepID=A0A917Q978_9HYPH|nr:transcriptional regulator [Salinarimonas ramus]GGK36995.1 transcriptional regulator [Salinarimonas ramus]
MAKDQGKPRISSEQMRAARGLLRWEQKDLARESKVSLPTITRLELTPGPIGGWDRTAEAIRAAFETAGIEFLEANGSGEGVRFRKS